MSTVTIPAQGTGDTTPKVATLEVTGEHHQKMLAEFSDGAGGVTAISAVAPLPAGLYRASRSDIFTIAANGVTVDASAAAAKTFAICVKGGVAAPSAWDVRLEGSLDNVNFSQILQHTNTVGDGVVLFTGSAFYPCLYFRARCASVTLGPASNLVATITGMQ